MHWTEEQIMGLAPDEASVKAGKGLANSGKWPRLGASDTALWGEAQGSGKNPYQTRIDLTNIGYKCSCPSRKFPCKHALGLFLLYARNANGFTRDTPPAWVSDWLEQRNKRTEKQVEKASKPVDEKAQAKRAEARTKKVAEGVDELQLWLKDTVRNGLAGIPDKGHQFWNNMAARMVDAQAPGLASMVRTTGNIDFYASGWELKVWELLTQMYLATEGFKHLDQLAQEVQEDVKTIIGWTYKQEELKLQEGITDRWWILGKQETQEDRLTVVQHWLKGEKSRRYALILQFIAPGQPRETSLMPATVIEAELIFYPGHQPLRAFVKELKNTQPFHQPLGFSDLGEFEKENSLTLAAFPWSQRMPAVLNAVTPALLQDKLYLTDKNKKVIPVACAYNTQWKMLALSGGHPLDVAGVIENQTIYPLGIWTFSNYHLL